MTSLKLLLCVTSPPKSFTFSCTSIWTGVCDKSQAPPLCDQVPPSPSPSAVLRFGQVCVTSLKLLLCVTSPPKSFTFSCTSIWTGVRVPLIKLASSNLLTGVCDKSQAPPLCDKSLPSPSPSAVLRFGQVCVTSLKLLLCVTSPPKSFTFSCTSIWTGVCDKSQAPPLCDKSPQILHLQLYFDLDRCV